MNKKQIWRTAGLIAAAAAGILVFVLWLLPVLLPFCIGAVVAALAEKPVKLLQEKTHLPRWLSSFLCVLAIFAILAGGLFFLCKTVFQELGSFLRQLPELLASLAEPLAFLRQKLLDLAARLPDGIGSGLRSGIEDLFESGSLMGSKVYDWLFDFASGLLVKVPDILLFVITSVLASFMTAGELTELRQWMKKKLPQAWQARAENLRQRLKQAFGGWFKAQLKLMGITLLILTAGFLLLKVEYPLLFALVTTAVDALPVLGTGVVLIPWALVLFLQGELNRGVGFLVLYGTAALIRQALEPRLVGKQIGLNPLITLMSLYIGYRIMGILGMIVFPISVIFLKQIWDHASPPSPENA